MKRSWRWVRLVIVRQSSCAIRRTGVGIFTLVFTLRILLATISAGFVIRVVVLCACASRRAHFSLDGFWARVNVAVTLHAWLLVRVLRLAVRARCRV